MGMWGAHIYWTVVSAGISRKLAGTRCSTEATYIPKGLLQCLISRLDKSGLGDPLHDGSRRVHTQAICMWGAEVCCSVFGCWTSSRASRKNLVATLAIEDLCHRTVKSYIAGIRHLHILEGHGDPFTSGLHKLHYVLRGVKRAPV